MPENGVLELDVYEDMIAVELVSFEDLLSDKLNLKLMIRVIKEVSLDL